MKISTNSRESVGGFVDSCSFRDVKRRNQSLSGWLLLGRRTGLIAYEGREILEGNRILLPNEEANSIAALEYHLN
jgi:hypothetical protein